MLSIKTFSLIVLLCIVTVCAATINEKQRMTRDVAPVGVDVDTDSWVSTLPYAAATSSVLYLPFSQSTNGYGVNVTPDFSGRTNDGTVTDATWTNAGGGSYYFDGAGDYIELGDPVDLRSFAQVTVSGWAKTSTNITTSDSSTILGKDDGVNREYSLWSQNSTPDTPRFQVFISDTVKFVNGTPLYDIHLY